MSVIFVHYNICSQNKKDASFHVKIISGWIKTRQFKTGQYKIEQKLTTIITKQGCDKIDKHKNKMNKTKQTDKKQNRTEEHKMLYKCNGYYGTKCNEQDNTKQHKANQTKA